MSLANYIYDRSSSFTNPPRAGRSWEWYCPRKTKAAKRRHRSHWHQLKSRHLQQDIDVDGGRWLHRNRLHMAALPEIESRSLMKIRMIELLYWTQITNAFPQSNVSLYAFRWNGAANRYLRWYQCPRLFLQLLYSRESEKFDDFLYFCNSRVNSFFDRLRLESFDITCRSTPDE